VVLGAVDLEGRCAGPKRRVPRGDRQEGLADLAQLLANYGTMSGAAYADGDLDLDEDVDLSDLAALLSVYGTVCP
jgi:hypothetical protein